MARSRGICAAWVFPVLTLWVASVNSGCTKKPPPRERIVHLDLSQVSRAEQRPGTYYLNAPLGRHALVAHDEASRNEIGDDHRLRQSGRAEQATHYATDVEIPSDRIGISMVTFVPEGQEHHELLALSLHPLSGFDLDNGTSAPGPGAASTPGSPVDGSGLPQCAGDESYGPVVDTAASLVFLHPEITTLSPEEAGRISCHIYHSNSVRELAGALKAQGPATTSGGWATLVPMLGADGQPRLTGEGKPMLDIKLSETTLQALRPAVAEVLSKVKRDSTLPNKQYTALPGTSEVLVPLVPERSPDAGLGAPASGYTLVADLGKGTNSHGISWQDISVSEGPPRVVSLTLRDHHLRWFSVYLEFLDAEGKAIGFDRQPGFCSYLLGMPAVFPCASVLDGDTKRFVALLAPPPVVMGIPLENIQAFDTRLQLPMPAEAVTMRLLLGSIGNGSWAETRVLLPGVTLTAALQFGLPLYTIVNAYGLKETASLWTYLKYPVLIDIAQVALTTFPLLKSLYTLPRDGRPISWSDSDRRTLDAIGAGAFFHLANGMVAFLLDTALAGWIAKNKMTSEAEEKVPIVGLALQIASVTAAAVDMGITTSQLLSNPAVFENRLTLGLDVRSTIHHDLDNSQFPTTARTWEVKVTPVGQGTKTYSSGIQQMPELTPSEPLVVTVSGIPSGGTLRLNVEMRDDAKRLVGQCWAARYKISADALEKVRADHARDEDLELVMGKLASLGGYPDTPALTEGLKTALGEAAAERYRKSVASAAALIDLEALLPHGTQQLDLECTLTELRVPLTARTVYNHRQKLVSTAGQRGWQVGPAPTATWKDTSCGGAPGALCELAKPTLIQRSGRLGYTWRSASPGLGDCASRVSQTQLWTGQAISVTDHPQAGLEPVQVASSSCGLPAPLMLAFDLLGPTSGGGMNVALVPSTDADGNPVWDARRVVVDGKGALEVGGPGSNGRLGLAPTAVAMHPSGRLVSVNRTQDKLEILHLSDQPADPLQMPVGAIYGGEGALPGLLAQPIAVAVGKGGAIYVLEAGNRRVQAFDVHGQPVNEFAQDTSPTFALDPSSAGNTLLDLAVESTGLIYVLSSAGDGTAPSQYWLDVYDADGALLNRTQGVAAAKLMVDLWRNVYSVNFEQLVGQSGAIEPSVSLWIPQTPP